MKLCAYGDSFVQGDQDDFDTCGMKYNERCEYLANNVAFPALIAKEKGWELYNRAKRGSGNYPQIDKLWMDIYNGLVGPDDIILFGFTAITRDRLELFDFSKTRDLHYGDCMIDKDLVSSREKCEVVLESDFYYLMSILHNMSETFNLKIIAFNIFRNEYSDFSQIGKFFIERSPHLFKRFIGFELIGNTLIDILNDTWGGNKNHDQHIFETTPLGYEDMYTIHRHPSIKGHEKIARWFLDNVFV